MKDGFDEPDGSPLRRTLIKIRNHFPVFGRKHRAIYYMDAAMREAQHDLRRSLRKLMVCINTIVSFIDIDSRPFLECIH